MIALMVLVILFHPLNLVILLRCNKSLNKKLSINNLFSKEWESHINKNKKTRKKIKLLHIRQSKTIKNSRKLKQINRYKPTRTRKLY